MILRLLILSLCLSANAATWYASTTGTDGAAGTLADPLSILRAINDNGTGPAGPGDTIYLRGGNYDPSTGSLGLFSCNLAGSVGNPIIVKSYPGERATLLATTQTQRILDALGHDTWFQDLEFANSATGRTGTRGTAVMVWGINNKFINNVIHDTGVGIYNDQGATNTEIYGNVIYYGGTDDSLEHGIYAHSQGSGVIIRDNIILNGYAFGIHCYTENPGELENFQVIGNTVINSCIFKQHDYISSILMGGTTTMNNPKVVWNMTYSTIAGTDGIQMGYVTTENGTGLVASNYFAGGKITVNHWTNLVFAFNTVVNPDTYFNVNPSPSAISVAWNTNTYQSSFSEPFLLDAVAMSFGTWKTTTGFDANSTLTSPAPSATTYFVRTNDYQSGRANITVYNWAGTDNVTVDVSSFLPSGARYRLRDAQRYLVPLLTNIVVGTTISVPMTNLVCAVPNGVSAPSSTGPTFGEFVAEQLPALSSATVLRNLRVSNAVIR